MEDTKYGVTLDKFRDFYKGLSEFACNGTDLYQQYAMMKIATKMMEERIDELNEYIVDEMKDKELEKQQFEFGSFSLSTRKTYKYTEAVNSLADKLKAQKKAEEESGEATLEEKKSLLFKA